MKLSKKVPTYKHFSPAEERILLEFLFAFSELSLIVIKHHELDFTGYWNVSILLDATAVIVNFYKRGRRAKPTKRRKWLLHSRVLLLVKPKVHLALALALASGKGHPQLLP